MRPEQRAAICRIEVGGSVGTGALVGPGLVLTALHVVAERHGEVVPIPGKIALIFPEGVVEGELIPGRWDPSQDWALIRCRTEPRASPLPLGALGRSGVEFLTRGFPEAQPQDGMVMAGTVRDHAGQYLGVSALQLFCEEAAAGMGAPVRGLSGAPVLVGDALVGVMRSSLMKEGRNVAGTLYACPAQLVAEVTRDLLPWPDPCLGLPGLPARMFDALPREPYRNLAPYGLAEAALLAGRCREIRALLSLIEGPGAPVRVIHGPTGVGKSSLLQAGLLPRLRGQHRYARRGAGGLLGDLRALLGCAEGQEIAAWRALEAEGPLHVILDQVEEAWTHPLPGANELGDLLAALAPGLTGPERPAGRLILSLRKEWLPDLVQRLHGWQGLAWDDYSVSSLDRAAIIEVVESIPQNDTLRARYRLEVEPGLGARIADDLGSDADSPVAPLLQILLTRLWAGAAPDADGVRHFTLDAYARLRRGGLHLWDFVERQLAELERRDPDAARTGLALDLLVFHVGPQLTALSRSPAELLQAYHSLASATAIRPEVARALGHARELYLLADCPDGGTRLAHDTLAPVVKAACERSLAPGQRARALLEGLAHVPDAVLDRAELRVIDQGAAGMRTRSPEEDARVAEARAQIHGEQRSKWLGAGIGAALVFGLVWALISALSETQARVLVELQRQAEQARADASERLQRSTEARAAFQRAVTLQEDLDPIALTWASYALDTAAPDDPMRATYAAAVIGLALAAPARTVPLRYSGAVALSPDGDGLACAREGQVELWSGVVDGIPSAVSRVALSGTSPHVQLDFSEDGGRLGVALDPPAPPLVCDTPRLSACVPGEAVQEDRSARIQLGIYDGIYAGEIEDAAVAADAGRYLLVSGGAVVELDRLRRTLVGQRRLRTYEMVLRLQADEGWFGTFDGFLLGRPSELRIWPAAVSDEPGRGALPPNIVRIGDAPVMCGDGRHRAHLPRYDSLTLEGPQIQPLTFRDLQSPLPRVLLEACRVATQIEVTGGRGLDDAGEGPGLHLSLPGGLELRLEGELELRLGEARWWLQAPRGETHGSKVAVALHPGGELLARSKVEVMSIFLDNGVPEPDAVQVYSTRTGDPVTGPLWTPAPVSSLRFTPDGLSLQIGDEQGRVRVVPVLSADPAALSGLGPELTGYRVQNGGLEPVDDGRLLSPSFAFLSRLQGATDPALQAIYRHFSAHLSPGLSIEEAARAESSAEGSARGLCQVPPG